MPTKKPINVPNIDIHNAFRQEDFERVEMIERRRIVPMPEQPRKAFDDEELQALADNIQQARSSGKGIAKSGIKSPLGGRWESGAVQSDGSIKPDAQVLLMWGDRRFKATGLLGLGPDVKLPVLISDAASEEAYLEAFKTRFFAVSMTSYEVGLALQTIRNQQRISIAELGRRLGRSKGWAQAHLERIEVDEDVRELVDSREGSVHMARYIQNARDPLLRKQLITLGSYGASTEQLRVAKASPVAMQAMLSWVKEGVDSREFNLRYREARGNTTAFADTLPAPDANGRRDKRTSGGVYGTPPRKGQVILTDINVNDQLETCIRTLDQCKNKVLGTTPERGKFRDEVLPKLARIRELATALEAIGTAKR